LVLAACTAIAMSLAAVPEAEAKPWARALITPHHAQSKLVRIPRVRRVRHAFSHRLPLALPARGRSLSVGAIESNPPILEELEIESVFADAVADDPSRRVAVVRGVVRAVLTVEGNDDEGAVRETKSDIARPPDGRLRVRMHPKHPASNEDADAIA
jgi:hypothetical protein